MPQGWIRWAARAMLALPLAVFFGFVGWYKAFATQAELAAHNAFTVHLPVWLGKATGWFEMAGAAVLLGSLMYRRMRGVAALLAIGLAVEQVASSIIHLRFGEAEMLRQNAVLIVMLLVFAALSRSPREIL